MGNNRIRCRSQARSADIWIMKKQTLVALLLLCCLTAYAQEHHCSPVASAEMFDLHAIITQDSTTWCFGSYGAVRKRTGSGEWTLMRDALPDTLDVRAATRHGNNMLLVSADGSVAIVNQELLVLFHERLVNNILDVRSALFAAASCGTFSLAIHGKHATAFDVRTNTPITIAQPSSAQFDCFAYTISDTSAVLLYRAANEHPAMVVRARATATGVAFDTLAIGQDVSENASVIDSQSVMLFPNRITNEAHILDLVDGSRRVVFTDLTTWFVLVPPIVVVDQAGRPYGQFVQMRGHIQSLLRESEFRFTTLPRGHTIPDSYVFDRLALYADHDGAITIPSLGGGLFSADPRFGMVSSAYQPRRLQRLATSPYGRVAIHSSDTLSAIVDGLRSTDQPSGEPFSFRLTSSNSGRTWLSHVVPDTVATTLGVRSDWAYRADGSDALLATVLRDTMYVWHVSNKHVWTLRHTFPAEGRPVHITTDAVVVQDASQARRYELATGSAVDSYSIPLLDLIAEPWGSADTFALMGREEIFAWSNNGGRTYTQTTPDCADGLLNGGTFGLDADSLWCSVENGEAQRIPIGVVRGTIRRGGVLNGRPLYYTGPSRVEYSRAALFNTTTLNFDSSTVVRRRPPATYNPEFHALVQGAPGIAVRQTNGVIDVVTEAPLSSVDERTLANQRTPHRAVWQILEVQAEAGDVVRIVDATGRTVHVASTIENTTIQYRPATAGLYVLVVVGAMGTYTTPVLVLQ